MRDFRRLWHDEDAATAVEYALIIAAIAGVIVAAVFFFGKRVQNMFNNTTSAMP